MSYFDLSKPIAIGGDHAGFEYKTAVIKWLSEKGYNLQDKGVYNDGSADYPDYAHPVANLVESGEVAFGILICGSANGVCMTANKHQGIRAALCWQTDVTRLARLHNNANIICIPARFVALDYAKQMIEVFFETAFEGGRHATRVDKISCV
ncbi:MAG TPA: ribose 5-phosphate isomerase B [Chitinophagaceae bacterium]